MLPRVTTGALLLPLALLLPPATVSATEATPGASTIAVLVQLTPGTDAGAVASRGVGRDGRVTALYDNALDGFAATVSPASLAALRRDPRVLSVEPDTPVRSSATQDPVPSWGLDRVDQAALPLTGSYRYDGAVGGAGAGVDVYVVDSGIRADHVDFGGRSRAGFTALSDGLGTEDCHGHGTHVAAIAAGTQHGVAKAASPVAVRVLDCQGRGMASGVIAGLDWIVEDHVTGEPAVANLSLGGPPSPALDNAVKAVLADGIIVTVAAGNESVPACTRSPARVRSALTVGATTRTDERAAFSNHGRCLDLFAPGQHIVSASVASATGTQTMSGTSMAAPHVAGAAAVLLSLRPSSSPSRVSAHLLGRATRGVISDAQPGSRNLLLRTVG